MLHVEPNDAHRECLHLPRDAVRFPVEWVPPPSFRPDDLSTWPRLDGRLEYVNGRIRYMPPCGGLQQDVASVVVAVLVTWVRSHPDFVVGGNEAGMLLGNEVRAADAAVWRRAQAGQPAGLRRVPPVLAVEVAGQDDGEEALREKARWYLGAGVEVVWLALPAERELVVLTAEGERRFREKDAVSPHPALPGLEPKVEELFWQLATPS